MFLPYEFDFVRFVGREDILKILNTWAFSSVPYDKRLKSIVAPPGTGKTWLMQQFQHLWRSGAASASNPLHLLIIWAYIPSLIDRAETKNRHKILNHAAIWVWLQEIYMRAKECCPDVETLDLDSSFA